MNARTSHASLLIASWLLAILPATAAEPPPLAREASARLQVAAAGNNLKEVKELIDAGADVNYSGGCIYCSPLNQALKLGNVVMVEFLLEHKARPTWPSLWLAAAHENSSASLEMVTALLEAGADPNARTQDTIRATPLLAAANRGHVAVVKLLLAQKGVQVDASDALLGRTPLMCAAANGHGEVVQLLLRAGADPIRKDQQGETAVLLAEKRLEEQKQVLERLRSAAKPKD